MRKQGDRVRIVAELVNAADGTELWSRTFDRELKDIFAVQAEIAKAVAASLELTLLGTEDKPDKHGFDQKHGSTQCISPGPFLLRAPESRRLSQGGGFFRSSDPVRS